MRNKRAIASPKSHITCEVSLHDTVKIPFNTLKEKFSRFGDQNNLDLTNVQITDTDIRGSFTNNAGVTHDIHFMQDGLKTYLDGSIYKNMEGLTDHVNVQSSVEKLMQALLREEQSHTPFKRSTLNGNVPS
ncbi:MAG: hypothetical protein ACRBCK_00895 [Alphaproteobacteria bacterium]